MNPITDARIKAGLSKAEFGRQMKLSRTFILRAEEGCYLNPGAKLVEFSMNSLEISKGEFNRRYTRFQRDTRIRRTENIEPLQIINRVPARAIEIRSVPNNPITIGGAPERRIPVGAVSRNSVVDLEINSDDIKTIRVSEIFRQWREGYWNTYIGFCQALCVHPASVENYERGYYDEMPAIIIDALEECSLMDSSFDPHLKQVYVYA